MERAESAGSWLQDWLTEEGLTVASTDDEQVFDVDIPGSDDRSLRIALLPEQGLLLFAMAAEVWIPRERWHALYPLLADANAEIAIGAWVLDPETSKLVYRLSLPTGGALYERECLRGVMRQVLLTVGQMEASFRAASEDARPWWAQTLDE
ncbi:MAG: hypothetical protein EP330_21730 [Deltaproteobacteria bacterium]|nr:MAG: hypothetical protein EP330_21730 [Deltaproteobacteria bacterium]